MSERRYTEEHVWASAEGGIVMIGISLYAQEELGEIVFVELPSSGTEIEEGEELLVIESVKATSELSAPVTGTVYEINDALSDRPELINESPLEDGWLLSIECDEEPDLSALMNEADYDEFVGGI